jgi:hypothetical protein
VNVVFNSFFISSKRRVEERKKTQNKTKQKKTIEFSVVTKVKKKRKHTRI